jgi:hypothetical protein
MGTMQEQMMSIFGMNGVKKPWALLQRPIVLLRSALSA